MFKRAQSSQSSVNSELHFHWLSAHGLMLLVVLCSGLGKCPMTGKWMSPLLRDLAAQALVCPDNPCGQQPQNSGWAGKNPFIPPWEACFPSLHLFLSFLLEICVICTIRQYLKFWKAQCLNKQKVPQNKPKKSLQRDTSSIRSRPLKHIFFFVPLNGLMDLMEKKVLSQVLGNTETSAQSKTNFSPALLCRSSRISPKCWEQPHRAKHTGTLLLFFPHTLLTAPDNAVFSRETWGSERGHPLIPQTFTHPGPGILLASVDRAIDKVTKMPSSYSLHSGWGKQDQ